MLKLSIAIGLALSVHYAFVFGAENAPLEKEFKLIAPFSRVPQIDFSDEVNGTDAGSRDLIIEAAGEYCRKKKVQMAAALPELFKQELIIAAGFAERDYFVLYRTVTQGNESVLKLRVLWLQNEAPVKTAGWQPYINASDLSDFPQLSKVQMEGSSEKRTVRIISEIRPVLNHGYTKIEGIYKLTKGLGLVEIRFVRELRPVKEYVPIEQLEIEVPFSLSIGGTKYK